MNWWELCIVAIIFGMVSMVEICVILASVSKMLDTKMKTRAKIEMLEFKQAMNELKSCISDIVDIVIGKIMNAGQTVGYKAPKIKPVVKPEENKMEEEIDPMDDWDSLFK